MERKCHKDDPESRRMQDAEIVCSRNERTQDRDYRKEHDFEALLEQRDPDSGQQKYIIPERDDDVVRHRKAPITRRGEEDVLQVVNVRRQGARRAVLVGLNKEISQFPLMREVNSSVVISESDQRQERRDKTDYENNCQS